MALVRTERKNIGGVWRTVQIYKCDQCSAENRLIKNWHGPAPRGGVPCSTCGALIRFVD